MALVSLSLRDSSECWSKISIISRAISSGVHHHNHVQNDDLYHDFIHDDLVRQLARVMEPVRRIVILFGLGDACGSQLFAPVSLAQNRFRQNWVCHLLVRAELHVEHLFRRIRLFSAIDAKGSDCVDVFSQHLSKLFQPPLGSRINTRGFTTATLLYSLNGGFLCCSMGKPL